MNRNFIFTFILLATLSTVYAVPYQPRNFIPSICSNNAGQLVVTVSPSTIASSSTFNLNISGKLNGEVSTGSIFNAAFLKPDGTSDLIAPYSEDFCTMQGINCPISAGAEFSTVIQEIAPDNLPKEFAIVVAIISQKSNFIACTSINGSS